MKTHMWGAFIAGILSLGLLSTADAALWPMEVGQIWTYTRTDNNGLSWNVEISILEQVTHDSEQYFRFSNYNYINTGSTKENFVRSTADTVYFWEDGVGELALFRANEPVGTTWMLGDDEHQRMANESIHVPYFGQDASLNDIYLEAFVFRGKNVVDDSPYWYEYFVPGIGLVREVDEWSDNPPTTLELVSISTVPILPAIWLLGSGIVGLIGVAKCKKS